MRVGFVQIVLFLALILGSVGCVASAVSDEVATVTVRETAVSSSTSTSVLRPTPTIVTETAVPTSASPTSTPTAAPTLTPSPTAPALPAGSPVVFFYNDGYLSRTDIEGSGIEPMTTVGVGETVWMRFWAYPLQISPDGRWLLVPNAVSQGRGN